MHMASFLKSSTNRLSLSASEANRCKEAGTLGAFLRREGIYSSMIAGWRKQLGVTDQVALATRQ
jgi:transposase